MKTGLPKDSIGTYIVGELINFTLILNNKEQSLPRVLALMVNTLPIARYKIENGLSHPKIANLTKDFL